MTKWQIELMQYLLVRLGYLPTDYPVDGVTGTVFRDAVKEAWEDLKREKGTWK